MNPDSAHSTAVTADDALAGGVESTRRLRDRVRDGSGALDLLVVRIGQEQFALPLEAVEELVVEPKVRVVPGAPVQLLGLFALGRALLPLYSASGVLGIEASGPCIALVMRGGDARIALAVDDADDVISVALADVLEAPKIGHHDDVVEGVVWRDGTLLTLLDARAVVSSFTPLALEAA